MFTAQMLTSSQKKKAEEMAAIEEEVRHLSRSDHLSQQCWFPPHRSSFVHAQPTLAQAHSTLRVYTVGMQSIKPIGVAHIGALVPQHARVRAEL
jgi:hypothetical protein